MLRQQILSMSVKTLARRGIPWKQSYNRAFKYFSPSKNSYNRLAEDFQLLNLGTLTRLTSKVRSLDDV